MSTTRETVSQFLESFQTKLIIWDILFRDERGKNTQTLLDLDITPYYRINVLKNLSIEDYCQGPVDDNTGCFADLWVFGKEVKETEVYIKITLGLPNQQTICISFHTAEYPMSYPLKEP